MSKPQAPSAPIPIHSPPPTRLSRLLTFLQWLLSVILVLAVLAWLQFAPHVNHEQEVAAPEASSVEAVGPNQISIDMQAPIGKRIGVQTVSPETVTEPFLQATGSILASRRPGRDGEADYWQFSSTDLLTTYTDYEKALADLEFTSAQLGRIQDLAKTKEEAQQREIERSEKLVQSGTEATRDLAMQRTSLLETRITNQKDVYEAETAIKTARRNLMAFTIQLRQSGLDPGLLKSATAEMDIVAAEVPEGKIGSVALGQSCLAQFFGLPGSHFSGRVVALSPVLSSEHRTLRVIFLLHDPHDELRPGMFAEIGIGADPRPVLRVPSDSVIHIGRNDYVLIVGEASAGGLSKDQSAEAMARLQFVGRPVDVTETVNGNVEIAHGLQAGDRIASGAVILLKPALAAALQLHGPQALHSGGQGAAR